MLCCSIQLILCFLFFPRVLGRLHPDRDAVLQDAGNDGGAAAASDDALSAGATAANSAVTGASWRAAGTGFRFGTGVSAGLNRSEDRRSNSASGEEGSSEDERSDADSTSSSEGSGESGADERSDSASPPAAALFDPILAAALLGDVEGVRKALGADDLDRPAGTNRTDEVGRSPLFLAAKHGHEPLVRFLVTEFGANVNQTDNEQRSPLWMAARNGHDAVVRFLVTEAGANVSQTDDAQRSPLWMAARNGHDAVVRFLATLPNRTPPAAPRTFAVTLKLRDKDGALQVLLTWACLLDSTALHVRRN